MSTKVIIHEIEQMGFWVEIEERALVFLAMRHFLAADGSLMERSLIYPNCVVADGYLGDITKEVTSHLEGTHRTTPVVVVR